MKEYRKFFKFWNLDKNSSHKPNKMRIQKPISSKKYRNWIWTFFIGLGLMMGIYAATTITDTSIVINNSVFFINGTSGNIGIGTSTPKNLLNVLGDANITGDLFVGGANITGDYIPYTGAIKNVDLGNNNLTVNGTTLFVDTQGRVGIGTNSPTALLDINGDMILSGGTQSYNFTNRLNTLVIQSQTSGTESLLELYTKDGDGTDELELRIFAVGTPGDITNREFFQFGYNPIGNTFDIETQASGTGVARDIQIIDNGTVWMTFKAGGGVGIGTTAPTHKLNVVGDSNFTENATFEKDINVSGFYYGNGSQLTSLPAGSFDKTNLAYFNESVNFTRNLNLTQNITSADYINANFFVGAGTSLTSLPADQAVIKYQNISNIPTCGAGQHLDFDGTTLSCTADEGSFTNTNVAYFNESVNFTRNLNLTQNITSVDYVFANFFVGDGSGITNLDTNESTRFNALDSFDCTAGNLVIGIQANGTVLCATDDTSFTNTNLAYFNESVNFTRNLNLTQNITSADYVFANFFQGVYDWIIGAGVSTSYLTFNGTDLTFDETKLNATIDNRDTDTNESTRFNALDATDCVGGTLVIGVQANGTVLCATDDTSFTNTNLAYYNESGNFTTHQNVTGNLTSSKFLLGANSSRHYIYDNGTCTFILGSTSTFRVC